MLASLSAITDDLLARPGEPVSPALLLFFVRRYPDAPSDALHQALGRALSDGLERFAHEPDVRTRWQWLGAFADASVLVADDALSVIVEGQLPEAVDALEGQVRREYEPGEGASGRGGADDLLLALALLRAFDLTARLPYAMLAEELLQTSRRAWHEAAGVLGDNVVAACRAAQLCFRIAALHRDPDYMARAVVAPEARYAEAGRELLQGLHDRITQHREATAEYGVALLDRFAFDALPN